MMEANPFPNSELEKSVNWVFSKRDAAVLQVLRFQAPTLACAL